MLSEPPKVRLAGGTRVGKLLGVVLEGLQRDRSIALGLTRIALDSQPEGSAAEAEPLLPVFFQSPPIPPQRGQGWQSYRQLAADYLGPIADRLKAIAGLECTVIHSANVLQCRALPGQIQEAVQQEGLTLVELDPAVNVTLMDDSIQDIEMPLLRTRFPDLNGHGIRVAVLDSGVDTQHPWLNVHESVSTCGEDVGVAGLHGTHVAGCLASTDSVYGGIAPGVTLVNVKIADSAGRSQPTFITKGIDAALDLGVQIISLSAGFNHLPTWSDRGHGWSCSDGNCQLCMAINIAAETEGVVAVVAAGNEHERAEFLRTSKLGHTFDTEIACPGQAVGAITVGAITKQTFLTAPFSSRGPTAFGMQKPDIVAPGVNITSCIPAKRDAQGNVQPGLTRGELSGQRRGTSMATPMVAGVAALLMQKRIHDGLGITPAEIRHLLLSGMFKHLAAPPSEVGVGRLNVAALL